MPVKNFKDALSTRLAIERIKIDIAGGGTYTDAQGIIWRYDAKGNFVGKKRWVARRYLAPNLPLEQRMAWLRDITHTQLAAVTLYIDEAQTKLMKRHGNQ
jgi:hypothetical protein